MTETLKPCPFCGGEAHIEAKGFWGTSVVCDNCGARGELNSPDAVSIAAWNARAVPPEVAAAAERVGAYLEIQEGRIADGVGHLSDYLHAVENVSGRFPLLASDLRLLLGQVKGERG